MHPSLVRNRDPDAEVTVVQFRYQSGGISDTKHVLDKNYYVLCGSRQDPVDADDDLVASMETLTFREVQDREDTCKRCTGQSYYARNTD